MNANLRGSRARPLAALLLLLLSFCWQAGCGNDDYKKPISQFRDASAVVVSSARQTLQQVNQVEENAELDRQIFQGEPFDEKKIKAKDIITEEEIEVRVRAFDQLSRYTSALGDLASLQAPGQVTGQFQDVGNAFTTLAKDADKLKGDSSPLLNNAKFSGAVSAATAGIGLVVQVIEEHKARREIERQIQEHDKDITQLTDLLGIDLQAAYLRRESTEGQQGVILTASLKQELERPKQGDPALRLLLGERLKDWRSRKLALASADPQPSIAAMKKSHQALVAYVASDKNPKNLSDLFAAAQEFFSRVQPLGQALASLLKST
ncbi:MAG TPA: hypothetical protein VN749_11435 [Candidatus Eisenbacteria bacterium]|jgi:hypothetical protein|nr:hypothetical protein [Candidatus Eisenbacteria bacterium]